MIERSPEFVARGSARLQQINQGIEHDDLCGPFAITPDVIDEHRRGGLLPDLRAQERHSASRVG